MVQAGAGWHPNRVEFQEEAWASASCARSTAAFIFCISVGLQNQLVGYSHRRFCSPLDGVEVARRLLCLPAADGGTIGVSRATIICLVSRWKGAESGGFCRTPRGASVAGARFSDVSLLTSTPGTLDARPCSYCWWISPIFLNEGIDLGQIIGLPAASRTESAPIPASGGQQQYEYRARAQSCDCCGKGARNPAFQGLYDRIVRLWAIAS